MHLYKMKALYNFVKCNTSSSQWVVAGQEEELSPLRYGFPQIETTTLDTYYVVLPHFYFHFRGPGNKHKLWTNAALSLNHSSATY